MGQANQRGTFEQRLAACKEKFGRFDTRGVRNLNRNTTIIPLPRLVHMSKQLSVVAGQIVVSSAPGKTLQINGQKQMLRRERRKDRVVSPRQQRKQMKAWRAEQRYEATLSQEIANHEANMDWQDAERDLQESMRESILDQQEEDHFSARECAQDAVDESYAAARVCARDFI